MLRAMIANPSLFDMNSLPFSFPNTSPPWVPIQINKHLSPARPLRTCNGFLRANTPLRLFRALRTDGCSSREGKVLFGELRARIARQLETRPWRRKILRKGRKEGRKDRGKGAHFMSGSVFCAVQCVWRERERKRP